MSSDPTVSGGGSIAVDTAEMDHAAGVLGAARSALGALAARASTVAGVAAPERRARIEAARALVVEAQHETDRAAQGLRTAALRYGAVEQTNERLLRTGFAVGGVVRGATSLGLLALGGPGALAPITLIHTLPVAALIAARIPVEVASTGRIAPQSDPVLRHALALGVSSLDDEARTAALRERPSDLLTDRPAGFLGTQSIAAALGLVLCRRQGERIAVSRTTAEWATRPGSIAELANRLPDGAQPEGQIRIEEYGGPNGRHWIVYSTGTVTFSPASGKEPFDMGSNLAGVGDRTSDSERSVLQAMRQAGIGRQEPVLFVGHSQGALNVVRIAEHGGYDVGGVVEFGGPTGQIALPKTVPVLAVEHTQDVVPALGGAAAIGGAGANRLLITRTLPDLTPAPDAKPANALFPAHDTARYAATTALAEQAHDARVDAFRARLAPFLDGNDLTIATRYHAERVSAPAAPAPTAAAGSVRRPIR